MTNTVLRTVATLALTIVTSATLLFGAVGPAEAGLHRPVATSIVA